MENTTTTAQPFKPEEKEVRGYYGGLPSWPKLVARTSSAAWEDRRTYGNWAGPIHKMMRPVSSEHPIVAQWNDSSGPLRQAVMQALQDYEWNAIDILRIGYVPKDSYTEEAYPEIPLDDEYPVTLLVSVQTNSTTWERGIQALQQCKMILEQHGIEDVHCEMKESQVLALATPNISAGPIALNDPSSSKKPDFSDRIGTSIAPLDTPGLRGTKCVYLRLHRKDRKDQADEIVALTCRHVVFAASTDDGKEYRAQDDKYHNKMIQPGQKIFQEHLESAESNLVAWRMNPETDSTLLASDEAHLRDLQQLTEPASRTFGHVLYSPPYEIRNGRSSAERNSARDQWVSDWALISLHADSHQARLDDLRNKVFIAGYRLEMSISPPLSTRDSGSLTSLFKGNCSVQLSSDIIPENAMKAPKLFDTGQMCFNEKPAMLVGKVSKGSEVDLGWANAPMSLVRYPSAGLDLTGEEWCIVGAEVYRKSTRLPFSTGGDSGACVWDIEKRIGGMMTAGLVNNYGGPMDVTYATPMERLLEDIKSRGFDVSLV